VTALVIDSIRRLASCGELPRDLNARPLDGETAIDELGIDSLGKLSLLSELEERAEVRLSEGAIMGLRTLDDLARVLGEAK
jgi:acyl carrier protein